MFDSNIQYYSYNNEAGDDFGVGYIGNKEFWIHLLNTWNRNDGNGHRYVKEEWKELGPIADFRGCLLAEVTPDERGYIVNWHNEDKEYTVRVAHNGELVWHNTIDKLPSFPRWINRLKKQLKEAQN